jgi:hypothetical protein
MPMTRYAWPRNMRQLENQLRRLELRMATAPTRAASAALCSIALFCGIVLSLRIAPYQLDDAFIAYRYAWHWVSGQGFAWNPHGEQVEGFSSPAWLALCAAVAVVAGKGSIALGSLLAGLLCHASLAWLLPRVSLGSSRTWSTQCVMFAWCVLPSAVFYAVTGLETLAFSLCVVVFSAGFAGALSPRATLVAALLAPWVRPEAPFLCVSAAAQWLVLYKHARAPQTRTALTCLAALLASLIGLLLLRFSIFGEWLPNTYYAKPARLSEGVSYLLTNLARPWFAAWVICATLAAWVGGARERSYLAAAGAWLVAAMIEGGDWMPQARMLLPALALGSLTQLGIASHERGAIAQANAVQRFAGRCTGPALIATIMLCGWASWQQGSRSQRSLTSIRREARVVADWVRSTGAHSIAALDIGEIGFVSELEIFDIVGLTDRRIAHAPGAHQSKNFDLGYLFNQRRPQLVMLRVARRPELSAGQVMIEPATAMSWIEARILMDERLGRLYQPLLVQLPASDRDPLYARVVFRRRDWKPNPASKLPGLVLEIPPAPD